ncbi:hypothetical protein K435DRAFT_694947, partial [Dendrothele bispora CBS 962.96]
VPIVDRNNRVFCVASPPPSNEDWTDVNSEAVSALEYERDGPPQQSKAGGERQGLKLNEVHRRGRFGALATGFSANGGMQFAKRYYHNRKTAKAVKRLLNNVSFIRIAGHASAIFATWAPKLYHYYAEYMDKIREHNPSIYFNFSNSIFAAATFNFGPQTVAVEHLDHLNYIYGWCSITALGDYDYTKGGHLILWDLRMVIEFPPGWTILIPSSYLRHGNTDISPDEKRFSFTQYTSGSLFRHADDNFKMRTQMDDYERKISEEKQATRINEDLNLYSTLEELKALYS